MISSEQIFKKFQQKFQEFSQTKLDKLDKECKANVQELFAIQTEYFIECGNEMINEMFKEFEKLIDEKIQNYQTIERVYMKEILALKDLKEELKK